MFQMTFSFKLQNDLGRAKKNLIESKRFSVNSLVALQVVAVVFSSSLLSINLLFCILLCLQNWISRCRAVLDVVVFFCTSHFIF